MSYDKRQVRQAQDLPLWLKVPANVIGMLFDCCLRCGEGLCNCLCQPDPNWKDVPAYYHSGVYNDHHHHVYHYPQYRHAYYAVPTGVTLREEAERRGIVSPLPQSVNNHFHPAPIQPIYQQSPKRVGCCGVPLEKQQGRTSYQLYPTRCVEETPGLYYHAKPTPVYHLHQAHVDYHYPETNTLECTNLNQTYVYTPVHTQQSPIFTERTEQTYVNVLPQEEIVETNTTASGPSSHHCLVTLTPNDEVKESGELQTAVAVDEMAATGQNYFDGIALQMSRKDSDTTGIQLDMESTSAGTEYSSPRRKSDTGTVSVDTSSKQHIRTVELRPETYYAPSVPQFPGTATNSHQTSQQPRSFTTSYRTVNTSAGGPIGYVPPCNPNDYRPITINGHTYWQGGTYHLSPMGAYLLGI